MIGATRRLSTHWLWSVPILVALVLPGSPLVAHEGAHWPHESEPIALNGQRIPLYEVFETFLVHASFIYETRGEEAYRAFLADYGLDPDLEALQDLPAAFDELEKAGLPEPLRAKRLGEIFAAVIQGLTTDPAAPDGGKRFRFELLDRLRPKMGWVFLDSFPDFPTIDEAEEQFNAAAGGAGAPWEIIKPRSEEAGDGTEPHSGVQVKLSYLGDAGGESPVLSKRGSLATFEWRRYAREDGSVRVIGLIERASQPPSIVDMTFPSDEHLRAEFQHAGIDGLLRITESFEVPEGLQEKHLTSECLSAQAVAAAACALCLFPTGLELPECVICLAAVQNMLQVCNHNHCDQVACNSSCVQSCHLYGFCEGQTCACYGLRFDIPGCELPDKGPCSTTVGEVEMLRLDGGSPVRLPTEPVTLSRLEASDEMHNGKPVSYLMGEWAVVEVGGPGLATKSAPSVRTLRSSSAAFATSQAETLRAALSGAAGASSAPAEGLAVVVAIPPHEANSRAIPMPALKLSTDGLPVGVGRGNVAIRADFSGSGDLQGFEILADTMGGVPPRLADHIERALSLQRLTEEEHRVVVFAVLSVGESLEIEANATFLPKCCCGEVLCV